MVKVFGILIMVLMLAAPVMAVDISKNVSIDGFVTSGKLFGLAHEEKGNYDRYILTSENGSWFVQAEIGLRYKAVRPFIRYEAVTHNYSQKCFGVDVFFYKYKDIVAGIRNSYINFNSAWMGNQDKLYSGVLVAF